MGLPKAKIDKHGRAQVWLSPFTVATLDSQLLIYAKLHTVFWGLLEQALGQLPREEAAALMAAALQQNGAVNAMFLILENLTQQLEEARDGQRDPGGAGSASGGRDPGDPGRPD